MTTHEMVLLCSSLQGVGRCISLCLVLGFATFVAFGNFGYPPTSGLKNAAACRSTANFSCGPLVLVHGEGKAEANRKKYVSLKSACNCGPFSKLHFFRLREMFLMCVGPMACLWGVEQRWDPVPHCAH